MKYGVGGNPVLANLHMDLAEWLHIYIYIIYIYILYTIYGKMDRS